MVSRKEIRQYDPFIVDSILMHYQVPNATTADRAAAVQEMARRGHREDDIATWLSITTRTIARLKGMEVFPLQPIPKWTEKQWPLCGYGHEMSPDNLYTRCDRREGWVGCRICRDGSPTRMSHKQFQYSDDSVLV